MAWFNIVNTNNRYWLIKTIERIHEGGFMTAWTQWAFHVQQYSAHKFFQDEEIPDSIQRKELWSIVLFCLCMIGVSPILLGLEILGFLGMNREVRCFQVKRIKHRFNLCVSAVDLIKSKWNAIEMN